MGLKVEQLDDQSKFRKIMVLSYNDVIDFVLDHIRKRSWLMILFWSACIFFLVLALAIRLNISGHFPWKNILFHSFLGLIVFPVLCIPVHEILHIVPYFLAGARSIRVGIDLRQYIFYVTAHRHVAGPVQFSIIATAPFLLISIALLVLIYFLPGLWKWSLSLFLFVHATMSAGDFALLNFYQLAGWKRIYTWDDADLKESYFYERL
jgi:hypothetical protein